MSNNGSFEFSQEFDTFDEAFDFLDEKSSEIPEFMGRPLYINRADIYVNYGNKKFVARIQFRTSDPQSDFAEVDDFGQAVAGGW